MLYYLLRCTFLPSEDEPSLKQKHLFLLMKCDNVGHVFNYRSATSKSVEENPAKSERSELTVTANYRGNVLSAALNLPDMSWSPCSDAFSKHKTSTCVWNEKLICIHILHADIHSLICSTNDLHTPSVTVQVLMPVHAFLPSPPQERMPTG